MVASIISKALKKAVKKKPSAKTIKEKAKARAKTKAQTSTTKRKKAEKVFKAPEARTRTQPKLRTLDDPKARKELDKMTLPKAKKIIADRIKKSAKPGEMKLRKQKEKLLATKVKGTAAKKERKEKLRALNKQIFAMTGKLEGIKNPMFEAANIKRGNLVKAPTQFKAPKRPPGYDAKVAEKQTAKVKRVRDANAKAFKVFNGFEREGKIVKGELESLKQRFDKAGGASELGMSFTDFKNMYKGPYYLGTKYSVSGKKK
jgi:hypothetical protein